MPLESISLERNQDEITHLRQVFRRRHYPNFLIDRVSRVLRETVANYDPATGRNVGLVSSSMRDRGSLLRPPLGIHPECSSRP